MTIIKIIKIRGNTMGIASTARTELLVGPRYMNVETGLV